MHHSTWDIIPFGSRKIAVSNLFSHLADPLQVCLQEVITMFTVPRMITYEEVMDHLILGTDLPVSEFPIDASVQEMTSQTLDMLSSSASTVDVPEPAKAEVAKSDEEWSESNYPVFFYNFAEEEIAAAAAAEVPHVGELPPVYFQYPEPMDSKESDIEVVQGQAADEAKDKEAVEYEEEEHESDEEESDDATSNIVPVFAGKRSRARSLSASPQSRVKKQKVHADQTANATVASASLSAPSTPSAPVWRDVDAEKPALSNFLLSLRTDGDYGFSFGLEEVGNTHLRVQWHQWMRGQLLPVFYCPTAAGDGAIVMTHEEAEHYDAPLDAWCDVVPKQDIAAVFTPEEARHEKAVRKEAWRATKAHKKLRATSA